MYQRYQALVKQFILKAAKRALHQLCQASLTEQRDLCKHTFISATSTTSAKGNKPPLAQI